jgi:hypothetical protein
LRVTIEDATALGFEFLDINPLNPTRRDLDQDAEDAFAEQLLLIWEKGGRMKKGISSVVFQGTI